MRAPARTVEKHLCRPDELLVMTEPVLVIATRRFVHRIEPDTGVSVW
jgi:hypothetical protein